MTEYLPSGKDILSQLLLWGLTGIGTLLFNKFIAPHLRNILSWRIPNWITYSLALYTVFTFAFMIGKYYYLHRPLELHEREQIENQTILLDGKIYRYCMFKDVKFVMEGRRKAKFYGNYNAGNTKVEFDGRASIGLSYVLDMLKDSTMRGPAITLLNQMIVNPNNPEWEPEQKVSIEDVD